FVLISSDSDFTRLASRIREQGLDVYGIGQQKTPEAFRKACKRFIFVENILETIPVAERKGSSVSEKAEIAPSEKKEPPSRVVPMILKAMKAIDPDGEWYHLGGIGQTMISANPDFDSRNFGFAKLSDLIVKTGAFEVDKKGAKGVRIRRKP
ncbi:MAG: NYN domain-containing protein, partial [Natronohydrobacter sp.]|nr:NYN domain-containing protein [Natronohydrobacter sp.]